MDLRARRAAENEKVFRRINERVDELTPGADARILVCECADVSCVGRIDGVTAAEYREVRSHADRFFVLPGHERPEVERVVDERPTYLVVAKPAA